MERLDLEERISAPRRAASARAPKSSERQGSSLGADRAMPSRNGRLGAAVVAPRAVGWTAAGLAVGRRSGGGGGPQLMAKVVTRARQQRRVGAHWPWAPGRLPDLARSDPSGLAVSGASGCSRHLDVLKEALIVGSWTWACTASCDGTVNAAPGQPQWISRLARCERGIRRPGGGGRQIGRSAGQKRPGCLVGGGRQLAGGPRR